MELPALTTPKTIETPTIKPEGRGAVFVMPRFKTFRLLRFWEPRQSIRSSKDALARLIVNKRSLKSI